MDYQIFIHKDVDNVGVAVTELSPNVTAKATVIRSDKKIEKEVEINERIPLPHKVALEDILKGEEVTEYGRTIGVATENISSGEHVHTHNLKGLRTGDN